MPTTLTLPDDLVQALPVPEGEDPERWLKVELALALYAREVLSFGQARRLAEMDYQDFWDLRGEREIPPHYGIEEFEKDLARTRGEQHVATPELG